MAEVHRRGILSGMHLFLAGLAVLFFFGGFVGFAAGGLPTILCWFLCALCVYGAWKKRPASQRARENRNLPKR